jgi:hypothetical protein
MLLMLNVAILNGDSLASPYCGFHSIVPVASPLWAALAGQAVPGAEAAWPESLERSPLGATVTKIAQAGCISRTIAPPNQLAGAPAVL